MFECGRTEATPLGRWKARPGALRKGESGWKTRDTHALLSGLDEVGGGLVPAEGARAGDHERLAGLLGVEDLAEHAQAVAEDGDERRRDVRDRGRGIGVEDLETSATVTVLRQNLAEGNPLTTCLCMVDHGDLQRRPERPAAVGRRGRGVHGGCTTATCLATFAFPPERSFSGRPGCSKEERLTLSSTSMGPGMLGGRQPLSGRSWGAGEGWKGCGGVSARCGRACVVILRVSAVCRGCTHTRSLWGACWNDCEDDMVVFCAGGGRG